MTPTDDLDRLLALAADGSLTDAEQLQLAVLLRDDPAAQRRYREYMLLDALLRWERPSAGPAAEPQTNRRRALRATVVAVAVALLVAVGVGLFLATPREAAARSDVIDRLADWNVALADAPTPAARRERFRERADAFAAELARSDLPADQQKLADALYANAQAVAAEDDPVAVAEKLDGMSERLLAWMWAHSEADPRRAEAMERHYLRFAELVRKAAADGGPDAARKRRMEKVTERIAQRAAARVEKEAERSRKKGGP